MEREAWQAVADRLDAAIEAVASRPEECARSPGTDFTRNRKLGLDALLRLIVSMGSDTLGMELLRAWGMDADAPTVGALCQQWAKLNDEAMPMLHAACALAAASLAGPGRQGRTTDRTVALKVAMECVRGGRADLAAVCARRTQAVRGGRRFKRRRRPRRPAAFTGRH